ncbi:SID1 transmembrane family member 1-like isoform X2 [Paramacrobiotus metropolitanus]|uniref:SID1 transmembrane family member 1-like isoform X2 n=1 Tax=Paramacrobiotus metropolitanus TaxID=2943436 RepID=UPI0024465210|nr:SID1 transmembrane family member 1-like isoform X2 [Paramacrobiotus metropolitanus]
MELWTGTADAVRRNHLLCATSALLCLLASFPASVTAAKTTLVTHYQVSLDRWYSGTVKADASITFTFDYKSVANETRALRLQVASTNATSAQPMIVVVREAKRVTSWEIPMYLEKTYPYWAVRRTLCPAKDFLDYVLGTAGNGSVPVNQQLSVDITTQSTVPIEYYFNIWFVPGFILKTNKVIEFRISPSAPAFFQYQMPDGIDRVLVRTWAPKADTVCSYLSVQPAYCPIADLSGEITATGEYMTFTTRAGVLIKREDVQNGKFDVALVALSEDHKCVKQQGWVPQLQKDNIDIAIAIERNLTGEWDDTTLYHRRAKRVYLVVENVLSDTQYWVAVGGVAGFYALFYLIFRIALFFGFLTKRTVNVPERPGTPDVESRGGALGEDGHEMLPQTRSRTVSFKDEEDGAAKRTKAKQTSRGLSNIHDGKGGTRSNPEPSDDSLVKERMDKEKDASTVEAEEEAKAVATAEGELAATNEHRESLATKAVVTVTEISMRPMRRMRQRDRAYNWTLLIIAVFYSLPVIQLVLTYQRVMESTGNMDMCYYNFECSHPTGRINDFNHVYSNIGYVALGLLFCLIVWKRHKYHYRHEREILEEDEEHAVGLPPQYGLFYAMGISLVMEGIMSACYHICPNYTNFQFDTSFMYLLGGLFLLKIYQSRHSDISPHAQVAYAVFAFWIFIAVLGVVIDRQWFWTSFAVILIVLSVPVGVQIYYMGTWKFDPGMFSRTLKIICQRDRMGFGCTRPTALDRFALLMMIFIVNWLFAIGGAIFTPSDFSTFLLTIVLANAFLYFVFYIVMKIRSGESIPRLSQFFMLLAGATWAGAIYFFFFRLTNWVLTPSVSRQGNKRCFFLDFYDEHDVWHMMSACSMFFNFMILFTLDDDLFCVPRREIIVF